MRSAGEGKTQGKDELWEKRHKPMMETSRKRHMLTLAPGKRRAQDTIQKSTLKSNVKSNG